MANPVVPVNDYQRQGYSYSMPCIDGLIACFTSLGFVDLAFGVFSSLAVCPCLDLAFGVFSSLAVCPCLGLFGVGFAKENALHHGDMFTRA